MYFETRGILLKQTPYSETSAVVKIYTEEFGLQSYMVKGLRSKKSKFRPAFLQPLGILDLIVTKNDKSNLQYIREVKPAVVFNSIPQDIHKTSILLFLNELLYKTLQEENPNRALFSFITNSIIALDGHEGSSSSFHLYFAMKLTRYLGFYPSGRYDASHAVFDLEEGTFIPAPSISGFGFISGDICKRFNALLVEADEGFHEEMSSVSRNELLEAILLYYSYHIPTAKDFKSHKVLKEILK